MKKIRTVALVISAIMIFGMLTLNSDASTITTYPCTIVDHIEDYEYKLVASIDLQEDDEVYFLLTIDDPVPETDLDMEVYYGEELCFNLATGYGYIGDPEIIEEGYFHIPYSGTYDIYMAGYYVPYAEGVDFTLYIDSAEELYNMDPLEPHGLSTGALTSYVNNNPNAMKASEKAPFHDVDSAYEQALVNFQSSFNRNSWTIYSLNPARHCSEDALIVGGFEWFRPASLHDSFSDAKEFMNARNFVHFIDGVPLADLTAVKIGPVQKVIEKGEVIGYRKIMEFAVFNPGELVELIGPGLHHMVYHFIGPGFDIPYIHYYFWLMPSGWTGPY